MNVQGAGICDIDVSHSNLESKSPYLRLRSIQEAYGVIHYV